MESFRELSIFNERACFFRNKLKIFQNKTYETYGQKFSHRWPRKREVNSEK